VQVYGYPVGGEALSVTSGVVSRIETGMYSHSWEELLLAQIDASINPGNSGGPVVADGKLVGIATQSLEDAENVGYIIPVPVIRHFLDDIADGSVDGFPLLGIEYQNIENEALRRSLRLPDELTGVLINRVNHGSPAWGVLQPKDVLVSVDGSAISENQNVKLDGGAQVDFAHLIRMRQIGDRLPAEVWRDGKLQKVTWTLNPWRPLVPDMRYSEAPRYFIFAGLVFQPLSLEYLANQEDLPDSLARFYSYENLRTPERSEVVFVSGVLKHPGNKGYEWAEDLYVTHVGGTLLRDFQQLVDLLEAAQGPLVELRTEMGGVIVLDVALARESSDELLRSYGILSDRSEGLD